MKYICFREEQYTLFPGQGKYSLKLFLELQRKAVKSFQETKGTKSLQKQPFKAQNERTNYPLVLCRVFAVLRQAAAVLFWVIDEGSNITAVFVVFEPDPK